MHICTVATLCFPEKTVPRNYYYCVQDENSLCLCFKNMYRTLFVAIFTSTFIFSMSKSSHTYRNINISNLQMTIISILVKKIGKSQDFIQNRQTNPLPHPSSPKNTKKVIFTCILHLGLLKAMFFSFKKKAALSYTPASQPIVGTKSQSFPGSPWRAPLIDKAMR